MAYWLASVYPSPSSYLDLTDFVKRGVEVDSRSQKLLFCCLGTHSHSFHLTSDIPSLTTTLLPWKSHFRCCSLVSPPFPFLQGNGIGIEKD